MSAEVVPLISFDRGSGAYAADESTLAWISAHTRPFGVVVCAGKYRTGKSFLMNQLSDSHPGFGVGETVQACTKGLWVRKHFFRVNDAMDMLYVDTEGIDALDATDDSDVRIFTLALLLSSCFVYNSVGHIDEAALSTLGLMTRVTEGIRKACADDAGTAVATMPSFYWVLRDFALRMEDRSGRPLECDEYLEDSLQTSDGTDSARGSTRRAIREFFPTRHLHTLPRPHATSEHGRVSDDFHAGVQSLRSRLHATLTPVHTCGSVALSGSMYASLCRHLAAHGGTHIPVMRDTWALMASVHARDLKESHVAQFVAELDSWEPDERCLLERRALELRHRYLDSFDTNMLPPGDAEQRALLTRVLEEAATRRIDAIGRNIAEIVGASVGALDALVDTAPQKAHEAMRSAWDAVRDEHGATAAHEWARCAGERSVEKWIPRIVRTMEREVLRCTELQEFERRSWESRVAADAQSVAQLKRDHANHVRELDETIASMTAARDTAVQLTDRLREDLGAVRTQNATLQTAMRVLQDRESDDAAEEQDDARRHEVDALTAKLQTALEDASERERGAQTLTEDRDRACARADEAERELAAAREREAQLTESWTRGLQTITEETDRAKLAYDEKVAALRSEAEAAKVQVVELSDRLADEKTRLAHLQEQMQTEDARHTDTVNRYRHASDQAQERVMDMHRSVLEELRTRDDRQLELHERHAIDQANVQIRCTETVRELEIRNQDVDRLKRRVAELESFESDCKRLRTDAQTVETKRIRDDAERTATVKRLDAVTAEVDMLRQTNLRLSNELAVANAERRLAAARDTVASHAT